MEFLGGLLIGLIVGCVIGVFLISLVSVNQRNDDLDEQAECLKKQRDRNEY